MPMRPVTLRRWEVVAAFIAVTVAYIVMGVILAHSIHANRHNKASIVYVEKTNCHVRTFLLSSYHLRYRLAKADKPGSRKKRLDTRAARVSLKLANEFANELCPKGAK